MLYIKKIRGVHIFNMCSERAKVLYTALHIYNALFRNKIYMHQNEIPVQIQYFSHVYISESRTPGCLIDVPR